MAASNVVCDCRSAYFPNKYEPKPSEVCVNSEVLKCELKIIQDELKSAWLIIEMLVTEVNILKASSGDNETSYKSEYKALDCWTEFINPTGSQKWIPVKSDHPKSVRRNLTKQSMNLITLTNSFEVLGNLGESTNKAITNTSKALKSLCVRRKRPNTLKKHSGILMGDSHIRGIAERLSHKLGPSFHTIGYVKPNATATSIVSSVKSELKNFSKTDVVVLCGGSLDIAKNSSRQGGTCLYFFKVNSHTCHTNHDYSCKNKHYNVNENSVKVNSYNNNDTD